MRPISLDIAKVREWLGRARHRIYATIGLTAEFPNARANGDIASMALFAGQPVGLVDEITPAVGIVRETISGAESVLCV